MNSLELADYLAAGLALLVGVGIGRRMRPRPPKPLQPICSCTHGFGSHELGGKCHGEVSRSRHSGTGGHIGFTFMPCKCLRYDGPDPAMFGLAVT